MPKLFQAKTADELWKQATKSLLNIPCETSQQSRQGYIREHLHCCLHIENPKQRWILSRLPAMNPAFAIAEVIWILQGRSDAAFLNFWNPKLPEFCGEQENYHGAYGNRLKYHFKTDQIYLAYDALLHNQKSRQVVLQIWDTQEDLPKIKGIPRNDDIPCNIASMLKVRSGKLEWAQVMRSNDVYRGLPHNIIQFTSLQEIIAGWLELELGTFSLFTDSLHIYDNDIGDVRIANTPIPQNRDSLMLPKKEFDEIFPQVTNHMESFQNKNLSCQQIIKFNDKNELPTSWANLLYIAAADSARRKQWPEEMTELADRCKNPVLKLSWNNWLNRQRNIKQGKSL